MTVKSLPRVECTSDLLNAEISHYLSLRDKTDDVKYWNLTLKPERGMYNVPVVYRCSISREHNYIPDEGAAYLQYGNDIFVIKGHPDKSFFKEWKGQERNLIMIRNRVPMFAHVEFFMIIFYGDKVFRIKSEY